MMRKLNALTVENIFAQCAGSWEAIHYGGKRKLHIFRTLCDDYNWRIEYDFDEPLLYCLMQLNMTKMDGIFEFSIRNS